MWIRSDCWFDEQEVRATQICMISIIHSINRTELCNFEIFVAFICRGLIVFLLVISSRSTLYILIWRGVFEISVLCSASISTLRTIIYIWYAAGYFILHIQVYSQINLLCTLEFLPRPLFLCHLFSIYLSPFHLPYKHILYYIREPHRSHHRCRRWKTRAT